jgi:hypothetical protein
MMLGLLLACGAGLHAQAGQPDTTARAKLEQQVRERIAQVAQERLGATDQQMEKLQQTNKKYDDMRQSMVAQERELRVSLRKEMARPDPSHDTQVASLLDRIGQVQRQRLDIQQQEQQELAGFLTPMQRAKYFTLEQQVRQRVNQMRQAQVQAQGGRVGRGPLGGKPLPGRGRGVQPPKPPQ